MPQFDPSTFLSQIFWLVVSFSFLLILMVRYLIPRLDQALQFRKKYIHNLLEEAKELDLKKDRIAKKNKEKLLQAHQKSARLFYSILQEAEQEKVLILKEFEAKAQKNKLKEKEDLYKDFKKLEKKLPVFVQETTDCLMKEILPTPLYHKLEEPHG